ncbi:hypothetical protein Taro_007745 [Colocasia esculenta]|uniref:MULE transposase domain-containing protein n=1 Tax=Colocasia esculenta TaxID=4460 RepID=A0A843U183_COLES|nr:hypothetical protein [Colocasia esculenta]
MGVITTRFLVTTGLVVTALCPVATGLVVVALCPVVTWYVAVPFPAAMDLLVGNAAGYLPAFSDQSQQSGAVPVVLAPPFAQCLELEGLSHSEVVSIACDPHPRELVEGVLRATSVLELTADWADSGAEGKTRPVLLVVSASVFSRFRGPVLECQSVVAPACVASRPCGMSMVRGGSTCGPSTLWKFEVAMLAYPAVGVPRFTAFEGSFLFSEFLLLWPVRDCMVIQRVHAMVAQLAVDSLVVVFPYGGRLQTSPGAVLLVVFDAFDCLCIAKAERAYVWRGLHRCRVVACGTALRHLFVVVVGLVLAGCELWLRCIAWLPCVLVRFPRTIFYCPVRSGEFSQSSALVVLVEVLPGPACDRPLSLLVEVLPRNALCSFWTTVVLPLWFEVCRLVGLRSGEVLPGQLLALLVEVLPKCMLDCASACALEAFHVVVLVFGLSIGRDRGGASCSCALGIRCVLLLPMRQSQCSVFCVLLGADIVVALLKLSAFRVLLLWVSGGESPSMGPVALSVVCQALVIACVLVSLSLCERVCLIVVPYFGLGPSKVDVLSSTSAVVFVSVWLCVALVSLEADGRVSYQFVCHLTPVRVAGVSVWPVAVSVGDAFLSRSVDPSCSCRGICGAKSLGRLPLSPLSPLLPFPLFSGDGEVPLRRSGRGGTSGLVWSGGAASWSEEEVAERHEGPSWVRFFVKGRDYWNSSRSGWIRSFSCVGGSGLRISLVCLSADVATARCIATSEEASAQLGATLSRRVPLPVAMVSRRPIGVRHYLCCLECFHGSGLCVGVCPRAGFALRTFYQQSDAVPVVLAPPFALFLALEGLSRSEVFSVVWDPHPREPIEGVLRAMSMLELTADLADSGAEGKMRCQSVVAPACVASRPCGMSMCAEGCFHCVPDSVAFEGNFLFPEFLLLWLVRDWYAMILILTHHDFYSNAYNENYRGKGLKEAIPDIFPNDHHGYCFHHIMQNFNDQCAEKYAALFKKLLRKIIQRIAYAITEQEYQDAMIAMELNSADAKEWVLRNDVDH